MKFADRLKFTVTGITSAGSVTPPAASNVPGFRTLATVLTDDGWLIGDTGLTFFVEDGAGNWEDSTFRIDGTASVPVLTRTSVNRSSAGGTNPPIYSASATLSVFNSVPAAFLNGKAISDLTAITTVPDTYSMEWTDANGNSFSITQAAYKAQMGSSGAGETSEAITVTTPNSQTANTAFGVSGTLTNFRPSALEWSINGGTTWNTAASLTYGTASGNTVPFSFTGVTVPNANALQSIIVRDYTRFTITGVSAAFAVNGAASTEAIVVNTPGAQTSGAAFNVTGTYSGTPSPTALDYRLSDDPAGQWTQPSGTVTISSGSFSFSILAGSSTSGRTITVRDRNNTSVTGTSESYVVSSAASPTVPGAPTIGTATAADTTASFPFTAPASNGGANITSYTLTVYNSSNAVVGTFTGTSSPIAATGLADGTAVYGKVAATNSAGTGPQSAESNTVTPAGAVPYHLTHYQGDHDLSSLAGVPVTYSLSDSSKNVNALNQGVYDGYISFGGSIGINDGYIGVAPVPKKARLGWSKSNTVWPSKTAIGWTDPNGYFAQDGGEITFTDGTTGLTGQYFSHPGYMGVEAVVSETDYYLWIELDDGTPICVNPTKPCHVSVIA